MKRAVPYVMAALFLLGTLYFAFVLGPHEVYPNYR